jgi:hypothetical protein
MARYDWPGSSPPSEDDKLGLRNSHAQRLWNNVADGLLREAQSGLYAALAALAEAGVSEAELDRKRWLPIGPSAIVGGRPRGKPRQTGRVRDLKFAANPDGSLRVYAASANGGVWFSRDSGQSWSPLGGMATTPDRDARSRSGNSSVIGCLDVKFGANADADTIYAGTGEPVKLHYGDAAEDAAPGGMSGGIGILKLMRPVSAVLADPSGDHWQREAPNLTGAGIYRIVRDPDPDPAHPETLVAATTFGLFKRQGAFARNAEWQRVTIAPFNVENTDRVFATDAVWVPAATLPVAAPARLFVGLVNLGDTNRETAVYVCENLVTGPFDKIALPGYAGRRRIALAAVMPRPARPDEHPRVTYVLSGKAMEPRLWRIDGTVARRVRDMPPTLFGQDDDRDQSWYDMAIDTDASDQRRIFFGGKAVGRGAALFRCRVLGDPAADDLEVDFDPANNDSPGDDSTHVGVGVHEDVHTVRVSADGQHVWVGCDGGVFHSSERGGRETFEARNTGLAVAQSGYVASHPAHAGPVASGTQDNGVITRVSDTIWEYRPWGNDGGGGVFHPQPARAAFLAGQYTNASWHGNGTFDPPVEREALRTRDYRFEKTRSNFYSGPATAPGAIAGKARLAIGTFRLWLTDDWDPLAPRPPLMAWRSLPSASDPYAGASPNKDQDQLERHSGNIISVKWLDPGVVDGTTFRNSKLLVLHERAIALIYQVDGVDRWKRDLLTGDEKESKRLTKDSDIPANGAPSKRLPWLGAWSDIAVHRATKAGDASFKGSFYVATTSYSKLTNTGFSEAPRMDTLWWYDGHGKFYPTGLRNEGNKAPAFAVICDPENADFVYVGTAMGVWRGIFTQVGNAAPAWTWTMFSIGLPEVVVQDLSFHWNPAAPNGGLKLLRAATEARGVWEVDLSANPASVGKSFLRVHPLDTRHIMPTSLANLTDDKTAPPPDYPRCLSPDIAIIDGLAPGAAPTEADFVALSRHNEIDTGPVGSRFKVQQVTVGRHAAHVLAHHRHSNPLPAADCKIVLLKRRLTPAEGDGGGIALSAAWRTAVVNLLVNGQNATLDDRWKNVSASEASNPVNNAVTAAAAIRNPSGPIDARMPRAATFQCELSGTSFGQRYLLLAIMTTSRDPLQAAELGGATVADTVLNSRHVCARTLQVAPVSAVFAHVLREHLDRATGTIKTETVPATPDELDNNFYNAGRAGTVKNESLQTALEEVLNRPAFRPFRADIAVALADLSGAVNKLAPRYAGFNDRMNFYAASTGKVPGMLAAYQLRADTRDVLANTPTITSFAELETEMRRRWVQFGIAPPHHPDFANVLEWQPGTPPTVDLNPELLDRFRHISVENENGSTAIVLMKFPFIASTVLAHGLFSPVDRTGLWCRTSYGDITYGGRPMSIDAWSARDNPFPDTPSNSVSAAQITQFMILAAQGRVIDRETSRAILRHLDTGGCYSDEVKPIGQGLEAIGDVSVKCGYFGDVSHDPVYFKATTGPREFVCTLLTRNSRKTIARALFTELIALMP